MPVFSTGLHSAGGSLFSSIEWDILYTGLNEKDNSQSGILRCAWIAQYNKKMRHASNALLKSSFICNNYILGKELSAGWDIPACEFEPDFAFGWAYTWSGTEMEIWVRLAYHRAHCVRIC